MPLLNKKMEEELKEQILNQNSNLDNESPNVYFFLQDDLK